MIFTQEFKQGYELGFMTVVFLDFFLIVGFIIGRDR